MAEPTLLTDRINPHWEGLTPEQRAFSTLSKEERGRLGNDRPELQDDLELVEQAGAAGKSLKLSPSENGLERTPLALVAIVSSE